MKRSKPSTGDVHFHFQTTPPRTWSVNVRLTSDEKKRPSWGENVTTPVPGDETQIADDGSGAGSGCLCVRGTAFDPIHEAATGVFAEVFLSEPDSSDHPSCPQGQDADHINSTTGEFRFDCLSAQHSASPGVEQWLLLCYQYTDSQAEDHYSHELIRFFGVTAAQTECGGSAAKAKKKAKGKKKSNA
ncbi:MAG: hypothetical protein KY475_10860 [Planctomycetes bacterium]|nr:hypothetical protein [Planctomycetota bacterium]